MDRNTVVGLVLIGLILSVFTFFNQPSKEEQEQMAEKANQEQLAKTNAEKSQDKNVNELDPVPQMDSLGNEIIADTSMAVQPVAPVASIKDSLITLETDKFEIDFNTLGGIIASVRLKEFESYNDYAKDLGKENAPIEAVELFRNGDASNSILLPMKGQDLNTADIQFKVKEQTGNRIVFEYQGEDDENIQFIYTLKQGQYDLDYDVKIRGFAGKVTPKNVMFNWNTAYRKTERLFSEQRRVSTVCFNYKDEGFSYLSEMSESEENAEDEVEWVNFKQSYFSSFIHPKTSFGKSGSKFEAKNYDDDHERAWTNLRDFSTTLNMNLTDVDDASFSMNWFFGPNDFKVLTSYESDYDQILNYGWGIFRWINIYAIQPLFNIFQSTGLAIGFVILILTIIIKGALMPIQWKMYTSSAKMRILKPEMEELAAKYPNKEDAMKKQMETMTLYRESGASPLSGCVPMLIQMPILLAVFRFFPSTFDLRQKSFLWAEDLSSYDSIVDLPFDIWFYGDHISLFTLLMAGTTLIYTFINSSNMQTPTQPGMPNMKVIMYFFPIMMIFFFNNYSSGLSYYYFISTLMSILIMLSIKKFFVDEEKLKAKMAARKQSAAANGGSKKGKSKFQERLEQMQKAQMEQRKNKRK